MPKLTSIQHGYQNGPALSPYRATLYAPGRLMSGLCPMDPLQWASRSGVVSLLFPFSVKGVAVSGKWLLLTDRSTSRVHMECQPGFLDQTLYFGYLLGNRRRGCSDLPWTNGCGFQSPLVSFAVTSLLGLFLTWIFHVQTSYAQEKAKSCSQRMRIWETRHERAKILY